MNLVTRDTSDSAMHLVCTYSEKSSDTETFADMLDVAKQLLKNGADLNMQNVKGYTPLHIAIISGHQQLVDEMLSDESLNLDSNIKTNDEKCALQFALTPPHTDGPPFALAKRLLEKGARPNFVLSDSGDSLIQILAKQKLEDAAAFLAEFANVNQINKSGMSTLHIASSKGLSKLVTALLARGASPNIQSGVTEMKTAIHFAVEANSMDVLQAFIGHNEGSSSEKADFNLKNSSGDSPLSLALSLGYNDLVPLLIKGGADVNARNGQDMTLLHQAIMREDSQTALFLLTQGADMNALTADQETPLQLAIHCRLPEVVDELCTRGVSFSAPNNKGDCPLWSALESDQIEIASVLVRHGVDTDCWSSGPEGCLQTLLHRAIDENKEQAAVFLIRSGCDLDSPRQPGPGGEGGDEAKDKASPLHLCCQWGLRAVLQTLIDHGANVNALDSELKTPLHVAIENQQEEIIGILLCHPSIDLKVRDKLGNTPFAAALSIRNNKAAQNILERLPNAAEQMDQRGRNFLHLAIMRDDLESVLFLLSIHVDVNSRVHDVNQTPPLHLAASSEKEMLIRNLILAGARLNDRDATQKTALHVAAERGNVGAVSALLQNKADFDAVDGEGNNALHIAVKEGHLSVVRELLTESELNAETVNIKGRNALHELCRCGKDSTAAGILELFLQCMPEYPINTPDLQGNTPLLLAYMRGQAQLCRILVKNGACLGAENKDGVTIFNYKLATNQLLHRLLDELPKESPWATSELCQECGTKFTITMRKHHW